MVNVERWPTHAYDPATGHTPDTESLGKYLEVVQTFAARQPGVTFGYYGVVPGWEYSGWAQGKYGQRYQSYLDFLPNLNDIANTVDVLMHNVYPFIGLPGWDKWEDWYLAIAASVKEARIAYPNKTIYAVFWPYQEPEFNQWVPMPHDHFVAGFELCRALFDGVLIWSGDWRDLSEAEQQQLPWMQHVVQYL